ncbi:MAG: HAD family hydrolase [Fimbriimonadaceae bacterium]|nr:HAD family hydrolase [Fimbriimonadaceae bacterium]
MRPQLVIFDCDGVLVDSEPIANRVFAELIRENGWPITLEETIQRFVGRSLPSCITEIEAHLGRQLPAEFGEQYHDRVCQAFVTELRAVHGVREAILSLDCSFCVASSSGHVKLRHTLNTVGLLPLFEGRIFSSEDVVHGKPAPDLFLYAAQRMGFEPESCVVVEDSEAGVQAGIAAGMRVLAYRGYADPMRLSALGATPFDDMGELAQLLAQDA